MALAFGLAGAWSSSRGQVVPPPPPPPQENYVEQGQNWTPQARAEFYMQDQGSRMMPLAWAKALLTADGKPFLQDSLTRYGYLANPGSESGLPVGFTASGPAGSEYLGMTCAACHTRQIEVSGVPYRIDGGPAIADFQALLTDLDTAVAQVRSTPAAFQVFAAKVLGPDPAPTQVAALRQSVDLWYMRQHTLFSAALPDFGQPPGHGGWGLGRLDAVSMILDRLTGLDIGTAPNGMIPSNIFKADAPVRYPFIWNAPLQDHTQWPGLAANGNDLLGLARNLGEVYGVFGEFSPKRNKASFFGADFIAGNSANFDGLSRLETLVKKIGPPKWPWAIDPAAAGRGKAIYEAPNSCSSCHGIANGELRFSPTRTWKTPMVDVGSDRHELDILRRSANTGVLSGAGIPFNRLKPTDTQFRVLEAAVVASILQKYSPFGPRFGAAPTVAAPTARTPGAKAMQTLDAVLPLSQQSLITAYRTDLATQASVPGNFKYEARVLQGVWASAPYLHNGSVASLAELLTPSANRKASFPVGRVYDLDAIGLASAQPADALVRVTTGCEDPRSGQSHCGHDFGTTLTPAEKHDLLEYLKTL